MNEWRKIIIIQVVQEEEEEKEEKCTRKNLDYDNKLENN